MLVAMSSPRRLDQIWPLARTPRFRLLSFVHFLRAVGALDVEGIVAEQSRPTRFPQLPPVDSRRQAALDCDILGYSGYPLKTLQRRHPKLLAALDAVIAEPFVQSLPPDALWRGSANQTLVPLTALGQQRYAAFVAAPQAPPDKRMQVAVEGGRVWMIGIPERGDLAKVEALCQSRGLSLEQVSWRR